MKLTDRQKQILSLAAAGLLAKECAHRLGITVRTVEAHRVQAIVQLGARNTIHAVAIAIRKGIIPLAAGMALGTVSFVPRLDIVTNYYHSARNVVPMEVVCVDEPFHLHPHDVPLAGGLRYCADKDDQPKRSYF